MCYLEPPVTAGREITRRLLSLAPVQGIYFFDSQFPRFFFGFCSLHPLPLTSSPVWTDPSYT